MQWRDLRGNLGAAYRPLTLVTTDSLAGKAGTAPIKTGGEMRKTRVNTGFHAHAESLGRLRRLRKSRYSLNNPETWARAAIYCPMCYSTRMIPFRVDLRPGGPIYEQIVYAATKAVISGQLRPGDAFPSVRSLSKG